MPYCLHMYCLQANATRRFSDAVRPTRLFPTTLYGFPFCFSFPRLLYCGGVSFLNFMIPEPHKTESSDSRHDNDDAKHSATGSESFSYADFTPVKPRKNRKNNKRTILNDRLAKPVLEVLQNLRENLRKDDAAWLSESSRRYLSIRSNRNESKD